MRMVLLRSTRVYQLAAKVQAVELSAALAAIQPARAVRWPARLPSRLPDLWLGRPGRRIPRFELLDPTKDWPRVAGHPSLVNRLEQGSVNPATGTLMAPPAQTSRQWDGQQRHGGHA